MAAKDTVIDWMYYNIAVGTVANIADSQDHIRTFKLSSGDHRFYASKKSIKRIEAFITEKDFSEQFTIADKGKTKISELHFKHYIDIEFTELGESLILMKAL